MNCCLLTTSSSFVVVPLPSVSFQEAAMIIVEIVDPAENNCPVEVTQEEAKHLAQLLGTSYSISLFVLLFLYNHFFLSILPSSAFPYFLFQLEYCLFSAAVSFICAHCLSSLFSLQIAPFFQCSCTIRRMRTMHWRLLLESSAVCKMLSILVFLLLDLQVVATFQTVQ